VDCPRVGFGHQLLMVSLAHRHGAIPIAQTWVKQAQGYTQKARTCVWNSKLAEIRQFCAEGRSKCWLSNTYLTKNEIYRVSVLVHWAESETGPWCLATNLPDRTLTLRYYQRRMWIEEIFGDLKGQRNKKLRRRGSCGPAIIVSFPGGFRCKWR